MSNSHRSIVRRAIVTVLAASTALLPALATSGASAGSERSIRSESGRLRDAPDRARGGRVRGSADSAAPGVPVSQRKLRSLKGARASSRGVEKLRGPAAPEPGAVNTSSFAGISRASSSTLNPPDTTVGNSPTRVLEAVNSRLRLTTEGGGQLDNQTLNSFFAAPSTGGSVFDPKVYYDRNGPGGRDRFYVVALQVAGRGDFNAGNNFSRIHIAVSRSADPSNLAAGNWCRYFVDGRRNIGTTNESWADYPGLGSSATGLVVTTNQFRFTPSQPFTFAIARILNRVVMSNNAGGCPSGGSIEMDVFQPTSTINDGSFFTLQPAQHYTSPSSFAGTANPAYIVSTPFGMNNTYRVYRIRNFPGASTLSSVVNTGTFTYNVPPDSPGGSGGNIDTGDNRVLQVAAVGNQLSAAHTTSCQFTGGTAVESCARVVRFGVGQNSSGGMTSSILQQNTFGFGNNIFTSYPGVALNNALTTAVPLQRSGAGLPLTPLWVSKTNGAGLFGGTLFIGPAGTCALNTGFDTNKGAYRAGDYSGAQTDTDGVGFWLAGERATSINGACQWATWVVRGQV